MPRETKEFVDVKILKQQLEDFNNQHMKYTFATNAMDFVKNDSNKPRPMLFPPEFIKLVLPCLEDGAKTHGPNGDDNWRNCDDIARYKNAFLRHWLDYQQDPNSIDNDSGHLSLICAACNLVFLTVLDNASYRKDK